jgi:hypothetical protein
MQKLMIIRLSLLINLKNKANNSNISTTLVIAWDFKSQLLDRRRLTDKRKTGPLFMERELSSIFCHQMEKKSLQRQILRGYLLA